MLSLRLLFLHSTFIIAFASASSGFQKTTVDRVQKAKRTTPQRYVFAHVVMGNWQSYQADDWENDIALAQSTGVDAFALNVGHDDSDPTQLALAYNAADSLGFALFISLDMSYTAKFGFAQNIINEYIVPFAGRTSQFKYDGKALLSTFSGETSSTWLEGNSDMNTAWTALKSLAASAGYPVFFFPFWPSLNANNAISSYPVVDGLGGWAAWPSTDSAPSTALDVDFQADATKNGKVYAAPVSAWFSVHLTEGNNYIYRSDDWLLVTRIQQILAMPLVPTFIEFLTWNHWGESHYLGPVRANAGLPAGTISSSTYVDGAVHSPMLPLVKILGAWYKTGSFPAITSTQVFYWYRPTPKAAVPTNDPLPAPANIAWTDDNIYVAVVVGAKSSITKVTITSGTGFVASTVKRGTINLVKLPFQVGIPVITVHNAAETVFVSQSGPAIVNSKPVYDFNYLSDSFTTLE